MVVVLGQASENRALSVLYVLVTLKGKSGGNGEVVVELSQASAS